jgi:hypothetical protein
VFASRFAHSWAEAQSWKNEKKKTIVVYTTKNGYGIQTLRTQTQSTPLAWNVPWNDMYRRPLSNVVGVEFNLI